MNNIKRGGIRTGAGRKIGTGKFGETTTVVRIPESQAPVIKDFLAAYQRKKVKADIDAVTEFEWPALYATPIKLPLCCARNHTREPHRGHDKKHRRIATAVHVFL